MNIPVLAMLWLHRTLTQAAITAGADAEVPGAVNVAPPGAKLLVPGVVVVAAGAVGETATRLPCAAALAMVEVVAASTMAIDRAVKPIMHAEAGIPVYWRVEGQGTPKAVALPEPRPVCHPDPRWWLEPRAALPAFRGRAGPADLTAVNA